MKIFREFYFEAAHHLPHAFPEGHPNHFLHGHSFRVRVTLEGKPDVQTGLIADLGDVMDIILETRAKLDHRYLNEITGLEAPTLEVISMWIWRAVIRKIPTLYEVGIYRDSCNEGCEYNGEFDSL